MLWDHPRRRFHESHLQHRSIRKPSRRKKHAAGLARTRFSSVAMSAFCPKNSLSETVTNSGPSVTTLLSSYALRSRLRACFRPSRRPTMKKSKPRLEKILAPPKPGHSALPDTGQHPKIRTSSSAISRTRLAALPWGPPLGIGRGRRELHLRGSGLDSRLQWRSREGPQLETRLPGTQHRVGFTEFPAEVLPRKFDPFMSLLRTHQT